LVNLNWQPTALRGKDKRQSQLTLPLPFKYHSPFLVLCCTLQSFLGLILFLDESLDGILDADDLAKVKRASSMPLFIIESLLTMIRTSSSPDVSAGSSRAMNQSIYGLIGSLCEAERIKSNPIGKHSHSG
jgi:hypothetical protein